MMDECWEDSTGTMDTPERVRALERRIQAATMDLELLRYACEHDLYLVIYPYAPGSAHHMVCAKCGKIAESWWGSTMSDELADPRTVATDELSVGKEWVYHQWDLLPALAKERHGARS